MHDVADARLELTNAIDPAPEISLPPARWGRGVAFGLGWSLAVAALVSAGFLTMSRKRPETERVLRFYFVPASTERLMTPDVANTRAFAVSPDGSQLVYAVENGATSELRRRSLDGNESVAMPGTQGATHPFFHPMEDGSASLREGS